MSDRQPPDCEWMRFLQHFKKDLKYDYFIAVFSESGKKIVPNNKDNYRIKDKNLGIAFHPQKTNLEDKIKFIQMESKNSLIQTVDQKRQLLLSFVGKRMLKFFRLLVYATIKCFASPL